MSTKEDIIIKDSCTIIDHCELGLLEIFFSMGLSVYTTPNVIAEITEPEQAALISGYVNSGHLKVDGNGDVSLISTIIKENPALSPADGSVLELAIRLQATILTSDGSLRRVSKAKHVHVRGSLWVIEEMIIRELLNKEAALEKLQQYPAVNPRAPKKEIEALIEKLKGCRDENTNY